MNYRNNILNMFTMKDIKSFCIQIADTCFRRKHRGIEHRKFIRLKDSISLAIRLVDCQSGKKYSKQINGRTLNISHEGLCIETSTVTVDGVDIFNGAMSDEKNLEIEIDAYQGEEKIIALGKVVWLDMTPQQKSFLFKAGVYLNIREKTDVDRWYKLVENAKKSITKKNPIIRGLRKIFRNNS
jgi:hypothetical protein